MRVLLYFDGGGAGWDAGTCDITGKPSFRWEMDAPTSRNRRHGILDFANAQNPFRDYTVAFVPYGTGDVHLGSRVATFTTAATVAATSRTFEIRHAGLANGEQALGWIAATVRSPATVFVTGVSAGAVASAYYALRAARRWPRARVVELGDGAGGYRVVTPPPNLAVCGAQAALRKDAPFARTDRRTPISSGSTSWPPARRDASRSRRSTRC